MVNSSVAIRYEQQDMDRDLLSGSANWKFEEGAVLAPAVKTVAPPRRIQSFAGVALLLAASSLSSCPDPWAHARQQRAQLTVSDIFRPHKRRWISARDARNMALEILYRAEEERAKYAQEEAERGIDWEEMS